MDPQSANHKMSGQVNLNSDNSVPSPRRSRLALSLRAMMVVILLIGGGLGWFLVRVRTQRDAAAAVKRAGGSISYDWEWSDGMPSRPDSVKDSRT
jgi:hypothetical protein